MKKGLFSILASALLVVGCQNYDDQFDNLETQINALASVVAGLSQVQSDITALSGTVASLQSSVAGTVATAVDTALADGLANIDTAVAALEDATSTAASSADVQAIADAVTDQQNDLDELLANSSVFNGPVTVRSVAALNAFHAMGSSLNIVNGAVIIEVNAAMDATPELKLKVQELINSMLSVTGDFTFTGTSTSAMPTFLNLSGVSSMTIKGAGDYRLDNIVSAGNIILDNSFKSKVGIVHLGALTTYLKLSDQAGYTGTVSMTSATEFHLTSLAVPAGGVLNITTKKDATVALTALTGLNSLGTTQAMTLAFNGAKNISFTNIKAGTIALTNVQSATISDFYGSIDINGGVENLEITKGVTVDMTDAADLITATIDMATNYDPLVTGTALATAVKVSSYKAMTFASQDLTTAIVSGKVGTLTASATNNLTSLTVKTGSHVTALVVTGNNDLENLIVTGATIGNVTVDNNDNMVNLTLDHTSYVTTTDKGVNVSIDDNADLEGLTINANLIDNLSIQRNADLVKITAGATLLTTGAATATIAIDNNNLTALVATDSYQAATAGTVDAGSYDDGTSGMKSFKTYFGVAAAIPAAGGVKVFFDVISSYSVQGASATAAYVDTTVPAVTYVKPTTAAPNPYSVIFSEINNATTSGNNVVQSVTLVLPVAWDVNGAALALDTNSGGDEITVVNGIGGTKTFADNTSTITTVDHLVAAMNNDTTVPGIKVTAARDAFKEQYVTFAWTTSDGAAGVVSPTAGAGARDLYFTYGTNPETGAAIGSATTLAAGNTSSAIAALLAASFNSIQDAYQASGTAAGKIKIVALTSGTLKEDRSSLAHPFQTFSVSATDSRTTVKLAGAVHRAFSDGASSVTSNTIAIASGLFTLATPTTIYNGLRVTATSTNPNVNYGSMGITVGAVSEAFAGNAGTLSESFTGINVSRNAQLLLAGSNVVAASVNSSALDFVSAFSLNEIQLDVPSTGGTTIRVGWLGL